MSAGLARRIRTAPTSLMREYSCSMEAPLSWVPRLQRLPLLQLDVQAEPLDLVAEHVEGDRRARLEEVLALHHGLVDLGPSVHVVGLDGEELLEDVGRAVRLEGPDLHFAEPLSAEARLAAEGLLRDQRVRPRRARVDLVVDEVVQLHHVDVAHRHFLVHRLARAPVEELRLAALRQLGLLERVLDLLLGAAVEHRRHGLEAHLPGGPPEVRLEDLPGVHAARHAERVEDDVDRRPVLEERHVLDREDLRHDALVAVAAGHLVADRQLALRRDVDAHHLEHARRQLVAALELVDDLRPLALHRLEPVVVLLQDLERLRLALALAGVEDGLLQAVADRLHLVDVRVLGDGEDLVGLGVLQLAAVDALRRVEALAHHLLELDVGHALDAPHLGLGRLLLLLRLVDAAGEPLDVEHDALRAGGDVQGVVLHVLAGAAEDRVEELLLGGELGLALRGHLPDEDVAGDDPRADAHDAGLVQVAERLLRDVRDVARELLAPELRLADLRLELVDVDGGVDVVLEQALADDDRVLEVVALPRHEGHEDVLAQRELAVVRRGAVRQHVALADLLAGLDAGLLVQAGALVEA